jgi:hypothetical protein
MIMPTMPTIRNLQKAGRPAKRASSAVARVLRRTPLDVHEWPADVTIRAALPADAVALSRLAALDEHPPIAGDVLVAEVGGELWAAAGIDEAAVIADPFRPSGDLALLLAERAGRVRRSRRTALRPHRAGRPAGQAA